MKNIIKNVTILMAVLMLSLSVVACGKKSIVGTWKMEQNGVNTEYTFNEDGSGKIKMGEISIDMKYTLDNDKLVIENVVLGNVEHLEYTVVINKKSLALTKDGSVITLDKQ